MGERRVYEILPMRSSSIGIGIIGSGRAGMIHARNFARLVPGAHVAAVGDAVEDTRREAASELGVKAFADYRQLLHDPAVQGVVIAAADKAGVVLQIGFMRRFDAGFRAAHGRVMAGEIGDVVLVKSCTMRK